MYYIEDIQAMYTKRAVEITQHFINRINTRNIKIKDIKAAIANGEIIEICEDEYPHPSILILGYDTKNNPIHIVIGVDDFKIWLITAYYPSKYIWNGDNKTRRGG